MLARVTTGVQWRMWRGRHISLFHTARAVARQRQRPDTGPTESVCVRWGESMLRSRGATGRGLRQTRPPRRGMGDCVRGRCRFLIMGSETIRWIWCKTPSLVSLTTALRGVASGDVGGECLSQLQQLHLVAFNISRDATFTPDILPHLVQWSGRAGPGAFHIVGLR